MNLFDRNGQPITDWRNWTRPKKANQWRSGRSAMELARAWFTSPAPLVPLELSTLLQSHELARGSQLTEGWPELQTRLPERGEGRNHDMVLVGQSGDRRILVAIEAKVDETMGPPIGEYWRKSKDSAKPSRAWRRIEALLATAFGAAAKPDLPPWSQLPYQMLTALVGTAIEAATRDCPVAALVIHEFVAESAKPELLAKNAAEFAAFLAALGVRDSRAGSLYGPFELRANERDVSVLIGKIQYVW